MGKYAKGGYIHGTRDTGTFAVSAGEQVIKPNGEVFRFEPCDSGLVLKLTGERYDVADVLRRLNAAAQPTAR